MNTQLQSYVDLLKANKNLILTGAPGTGKTHLAKEIAKEIGAETGFVQFHPSYDYTDFVEGLRPKEENGIVGFERKNGVFKEFCKDAVSTNKSEFLINERYQELLKQIKSGSIKKLKLRSGIDSQVLSVRGESILFGDPDGINESNTVTRSRLMKLYKGGIQSKFQLYQMKNISERALQTKTPEHERGVINEGSFLQGRHWSWPSWACRGKWAGAAPGQGRMWADFGKGYWQQNWVFYHF